MTKFRGAVLLVVLLCGLVLAGVPVDVLATGTSVNVSYSTSDSTTIGGGVNILYANGTYDLTTYNTPTWQSGGLIFNPTTGKQYARAASAPSATLASLSTEIWTYVTNITQSYGYIFSTFNGSDCQLIAFNGNQIYIEALNSVGRNVVLYSSATVAIGHYYYVTATWNSTYEEITVNGTVDSQSWTASSWNVNQAFGFARRNNYDSNYFNGTILDAKVFYNYSLPSSVRIADFSRYKQPSTVSTTGWYPFDEGSGSYVYGYDATANLAPSQSITVSQTSGAVNSSVIITDPTPYQNATDLYNGTYYSQRSNSTTLNFAFNHYVYETFSVSPAGSGTVNLTTAWYPTLTAFGISATPYIGMYFQYWTRDGVQQGTGNPSTVYPTASHVYAAVFAATPYVAPVSTSPTGQTVAWVAILFYIFFFSMSVISVAIAPFRRFLLVLMFAFLDILFGLAQLTVSGTTLPASPWSEIMMILLGAVLITVAANAKPTIPTGKR
jgi:hypothetical protein